MSSTKKLAQSKRGFRPGEVCSVLHGPGIAEFKTKISMAHSAKRRNVVRPILSKLDTKKR